MDTIIRQAEQNSALNILLGSIYAMLRIINELILKAQQ